MEPLVKLESVSKIYKMDGLSVTAVDDVSLEIKEGEFIAITGKSGCGKSTLMHMLGCLATPTKGKIFIDGKDVSKLTEAELAKVRNEKIGFIFQTFNLLARASALDNVILPLTYSKVAHSERRAWVLKLLTDVGLADRLDHKPNQLSGGQQQRVAIARALVNNPKIVIGDEPTGNLDTKSGEEIIKILTKINEEGRTVVIVTHDLELAKKAKRIVKMMDGKIVK